MKKQWIFGALCTFMFLSVSCAKESRDAENNMMSGITVLSAGFDDSSLKTILQEDGKVSWLSGDQISVNGTPSTALTLDEPAAYADFTIPAVLSYPYKATYPASIQSESDAVILPSTQAAGSSDSFAAGAAPMAGYATSGNQLYFRHLCALIRLGLVLGEDKDTIRGVTFSGNKQEQVCGPFTLDYETGTLSATSSEQANQAVQVLVGKNLSSTATPVFIAVPAGTYENGFSIKIIDVNGHTMTVAKHSSTTLVAGHIYPGADIVFAPTATELRIDITSAAELNAFATAYNAGEIAHSSSLPLIVTLKNDISYSSEDLAGFVQMGMPGLYFSGTFDGQGHSISGFDTDAPLFYGVGSEGIVKDFTLNGRMTATLCASVNAGSGYWESYLATVTGYLRGVLSGITSSVNLTVTQPTLEHPSETNSLLIGGIAGKLVSSAVIEDCTYSGTLSDDAGFTGSTRVYIGGICGAQNNASSIVRRCAMTGSISLQGTSSATRYNVGGVEGRLMPGILTDCTNTGTISIAVNDAFASSCNSYLGGICGAVQSSSSYSGLENAGSVTVTMNAYQGAALGIGGVFGNVQQASSTTPELSNSGDVTLSATAPWTAYTAGIRIGGVIGYASSDASVSGMSNSGVVKYIDNDTDGTVTGSNLYMGGVIGFTGNSVSGCSNTGEVWFDVSRGQARSYNNVSYAGVLGGNSGNIIVSDCENDGYVHGGINLTGSTGVNWTAGIVGYLCGASTLSGCVNRGAVTNRHWYNSTQMNPTSSVSFDGTGGIVGAAVGNSGTGNGITIENCSLPAGGSTLNSKRGATGGIAAYTDYATVTGCTVSVNLNDCDTYTSNGYFLGGIVCVANHTTLSGCHMRGTIDSTQKKYLGGIVGGAYNSSVIDGCTFKGEIASTTASSTGYGTIAGFAQKTCTLSNNRFAGTVDGTSMSADTQVTSGSPTLSNNAYDTTLE